MHVMPVSPAPIDLLGSRLQLKGMQLELAALCCICLQELWLDCMLSEVSGRCQLQMLIALLSCLWPALLSPQISEQVMIDHCKKMQAGLIQQTSAAMDICSVI